MNDSRPLWDSERLDDVLAGAAVVMIFGLTVVRGSDLIGQIGQLVAVTLAFAAYPVVVLRRQWGLLAGCLGFVVATLVSGTLARLMGVPWETNLGELVWLCLVWIPWPTLRSRGSLVVLWALAVAPIVMLLLGPPLGDLSWTETLLSGGRLRTTVGANAIGIQAGLSVLAALVLRGHRDTWPRYVWQVVGLVLAGSAGTRMVLPAMLAAGALWLRSAWGLPGRLRRLVVEVLPWAVYGALGLRTMVFRSTMRLEEGLDAAASGRMELWSQYWVHARERLATGGGIGTTDRILEESAGSIANLPHNAFLTLTLDMGIPAAAVAVTGLVVFLTVRLREIQGRGQDLMRLPLVALFAVMLAVSTILTRAPTTVPIMLFLAAAPWAFRERRPSTTDGP